MDMQRSIDISQAAILSYQDNYVDVYSCSWGPPETGFTVGGPEYLTLETFKRESKQVRLFCWLVFSVCHVLCFVMCFVICLFMA